MKKGAKKVKQGTNAMKAFGFKGAGAKDNDSENLSSEGNMSDDGGQGRGGKGGGEDKQSNTIM